MAAAPVAAAVDGKTSKQARDADGDALHVLNVFAHDARVSPTGWPVGDGKDTEPEVLKAHLDDLFARWPSLRVLTGDALFCQPRWPARSSTRGGTTCWRSRTTNRTCTRQFGPRSPTPPRRRPTPRRVKKSGAVETRHIWCDADTAAYAREALKFPGLRAVVRVDRHTRAADGTRTCETRHFATKHVAGDA
jgi:hypothetical protein